MSALREAVSDEVATYNDPWQITYSYPSVGELLLRAHVLTARLSVNAAIAAVRQARTGWACIVRMDILPWGPHGHQGFCPQFTIIAERRPVELLGAALHGGTPSITRVTAEHIDWIARSQRHLLSQMPPRERRAIYSATRGMKTVRLLGDWRYLHVPRV